MQQSRTSSSHAGPGTGLGPRRGERRRALPARLASLACIASLARLASLACLAFLLCAPAPASAGPVYKNLVSPDFRHLLVLHSGGQGSAPVEGMNEGIDKVLAVSDFHVLRRVEHMDLGQATDPHYLELLEELLRIKYRNADFDGIVTSGLPALRLAARLRNALFPDTVIIAAGVDTSGELPPNLDGIHIVRRDPQHGPTLELALAQNPDARRVIVVNIPPPGEPDIGGGLVEALKALPGDLDVELLEHAPQADLEARLGEADPADVVYLAEYAHTADNGLDMSFEDVRRMAYASPAPIYVNQERFLGSGVVGGRVTCWREHGRRATWMLLDRWRGRYVQKQFEDMANSAHTVLDHGPLERFGLDAGPAGRALVINEPKSTFDDYRKYFDIYSVGGVFFVLILVMAVINARQKARRRRRAAG